MGKLRKSVVIEVALSMAIERLEFASNPDDAELLEAMKKIQAKEVKKAYPLKQGT